MTVKLAVAILLLVTSPITLMLIHDQLAADWLAIFAGAMQVAGALWPLSTCREAQALWHPYHQVRIDPRPRQKRQ